MDELISILFDSYGKKFGHPEFDPSLHDLHEDNSLWLEVCDEHGIVVATSAARLIETQDFIELARSYRLWYGDKIRFVEQLKIVVASDVPIPAGRIVLDGAMWVHPDQRRRGISWILSMYLKAATFSFWNPDWYFGLAYPGITRSRLPLYSYGFPRLDPFIAAYRLPGCPSHDLSLASMSRAEYLRLVELEQNRLRDWQDIRIGQELASRIRAGIYDPQRQPLGPVSPDIEFGIAN